MNGEQLIVHNDIRKRRYDSTMNNHIYCEFDTDFRTTVLNIDSDYRHKGLIITYIENDNPITYMYINAATDDNSWISQSNWKKLTLI